MWEALGPKEITSPRGLRVVYDSRTRTEWPLRWHSRRGLCQYLISRREYVEYVEV